MPKPPQLDPGGAAGKAKAEEGPQSHVAVRIDHRPGNPGLDLRRGQGPHGSRARDIGRDNHHGADDKEYETAARQDIVVHGKRGQEKTEREHKSDRREVIQDHMDMRPGLRSRHKSALLLRVQKELVVTDLPAVFSREDH